jgi:flagellar hook-associated protein 2
MVTRIQLGNLVSNDGRTRLIGTESALDSESIINALTEARRVPAVRLETKNEEISTKQTALNSLRSLLNRFTSAANVLRNPPGVNNASANIFEFRTTSLIANNGLVSSNFLSVAAEPGASIQSFNITDIAQIARETRQESGTFLLADSTTASAVTTAATPGLFTAGSFTLRDASGGPAVAVTLNDGDSLQAVANRFNEVSDRTGIAANIIKVADGVPNDSFKIIFTATQAGQTFGFDLNDPGTVISDPGGVLANITVTTSQTAQNARFFVDGIQIDRETNVIDDVFDGLTFTLLQQTAPGDNINVAVQPDTEIASNAIFNFADIYNEFRLFAASQTELGDDGVPTEGAILSGDSTLRGIISRVATEITGVVNGITGGNPARLADIGLDFSDFAGDEDNPFTRNILTVDTDELSSALAADFNGVRGLFEFQLQADNANLVVFRSSNEVSISQFTLNINQSTGVYTADYIDSLGAAQSVTLDGTPIAGGNGVSLVGQAGSVLDGIELIFASAGNTSINVNTTQGLGDRLFNVIDSIVDDDGGFLTTAIEQLDTQTTRNLDEISRIDSQLEIFRRQLEEQYTALEAALSRANSLLTLLDAQARANDR